jgi:hypothetical protein
VIVGDYSYDYAYEERRPGLWVADVDIPGLRLQLQDIFLPAESPADLAQKLDRFVYHFVYNLRHLTRAAWN